MRRDVLNSRLNRLLNKSIQGRGLRGPVYFVMTRENFTKLFLCIAQLALAFVLLLSLLSFSNADSSFYSATPSESVTNLIGILGVNIAQICFFTLGKASYIIVLAIVFSALRRVEVIEYESIAADRATKTISLLIILTYSATMLSLFGENTTRFLNGGIVGFISSSFLLAYTGKTGAFIITSAIMLIGIGLLWTELFLKFCSNIKNILINLYERTASRQPAKKSKKLSSSIQVKRSLVKDPVIRRKNRQNVKEEEISEDEEEYEYICEEEDTDEDEYTAEEDEQEDETEHEYDDDEEDTSPAARIRSALKINIKKQPRQQKQKEYKQKTIRIKDLSYTLPTPDILTDLPEYNEDDVKLEIEENAKLLEGTLLTFGISARVVNADRGPTITRYELELAPGIKINRIANLADDITMAMSATQVRIVAPIPGKGTVGVELPNQSKKIVYLRECLEHTSFIKKKDSPTTISVGQDVAGTPLVAEISEMPHLLIAGSTGAGKTVCINTLICSMLFKAAPWELKLILIDPKMVEMTQYADIPHLFTPIVSDAKKATSVLLWAVEEMERRYTVLAEATARNITSFNEKKDIEERMPYIVIVVDELADLMMVARDKIETAITRIAQLARAVGIHLVLATQRPSSDIITGVIKNNLPARIAFKVPTQIDSRVILDHMGAEKLLGKGDMLFLGPGLHKPIRAQASFIKDEDINTIVEFIKDQNIPVVYNQKIADAQKKSEGGINGERDDLLDDAIKVVLETGQASASILQRRMRVGYNRAARLVDQMEAEGIVGPFQGSKPRTILVDPDRYLSGAND